MEKGLRARACTGLCVLIGLWLLPAGVAHSYSVLQTRYFNIIHEEPHRELARHLAQIADVEYEALLAEFDMNIAPRIDLLIDDRYGDAFNASATLANKPLVTISPAAHITGELINTGDTVRLVLRHELVHILTGRYTSEPDFYRFGYVPGNNTFVPLAFHEGYAQWFESDPETGTGRARRHHPDSEGLWQQEYQRGFRGYTEVFATGRHESLHMAYLYGAYFFTRLAERFGDEAVRDWLDERTGRHGFWADLASPYNLNIAWQVAFDERLSESWDEFLAHESERLQARLGQSYPHAAEQLRDGLSRFGSPQAVSRSGDYFIWYDHREGLGRPTLVVEDAAGNTRRHRGFRPEQLAAGSTQLWFNQLEECNGRLGYSLYSMPLEQDSPQRAERCARVARLAWHEDSAQMATWTLTDAGSELQLRDGQGQVTDILLRGQAGVQIKQLSWHPSGERLVLTMKPDFDAAFDLYELQLADGRLTRLTADNHIPRGAHWADESTLLFSQARNQRLQAVALTPATGERQWLTDLPVNVHQPRLQDDQLVFLTESGRHYQQMRVSILSAGESSPPSSVPEPNWQHPASLTVLVDADAAAPAAETEEADPALHPYYAIEHMSPSLFAPYPYWDGELGFGLTGDWREPTDRHQVQVQVELGLFSGDISGTLDYRFYNHWSLGVGQARVSRGLHSGYRAGWARRLWSGQGQAVGADLAWVTDYRLPDSDQDGLRRRWLGGGLDWHYSERNTERYRPNRAFALGLDAERAFSHADSHRLRLRQSSELGLFGQHSLHWRQQVLWTDDAQRPFEAGGSESFSVFPRPISSKVTLRALPEPLAASELYWSRAELNVLLAEPDRTLGTLGLGAGTLWLTSYAATAWDLDQQARYNLGAELGLTFSALWLLPLEASLGYAHNPERDEVGEIYFSLGPSF
ncbi:hypothetical protein E4656_17385 [Natronospirillum operosum]|uniref:Bacterial surface antigen (D15) domain-containing protein n=1 Tax=Natronospirillum operosum TaxID=2759953 RepID=A0A4Z0WC61_9GAMM|nr:hypothetical protein [Natronospirillum operosum]TGG91160.1 hypothetical protein E4656_17385 [Natronospirillum operosum]